MAAWYKHDIAAWMDGTEDLDHEAYRVYHVICQLIYLHEGPITLNECGIAGRCNQHVLKFRKNLLTLIELGKIRLADGKLHNARAESELNRLPTRRQPKTNPQPTPEQPPHNPPGVSRGLPSQAIENTHTKKQTRLDKTRPDQTKRAAALPRSKLIPIPADFTLTSDRAQVAARLSLDAQATFRRFRIWAEGKDERLANWDVRWVGWCEDQSVREKRFAPDRRAADGIRGMDYQ